MKKLSVLYVEDEPTDVDLLQTVLAECGLSDRVKLKVVEDGDQALAFLRREPPYEMMESPDLMLMDLNTPKTDGRTLLRELKKSDRLRRLPVVIFSTSGSPSDVDDVFTSGASMFLVKPMLIESYKTLVRSLYEIWSNHSRFPTRV